MVRLPTEWRLSHKAIAPAQRKQRWETALRAGGSLLLLSVLAGCPQYRDPSVPNPIHRIEEPASGADYLIYQPSNYDPTKSCPLVVVCHGTPPFDYPLRQIRDWVRLAEEKGFVVVAPFLKGTQANPFRPAAKQIDLQRRDEGTILQVVRHVQGSHSISRDRIFLAGWSAGNYAVLYTGLRHPEVFRAIADLQGNFNAALLTDAADRIDPNQPIYVLYGSLDVLTGEDASRCIEWLRSHGANVTEEIARGAHMGHPTKACEFFEHVIRALPWLHIRVFQDPDQPRKVQFKTFASFEPATYLWSFGDNETSPVASPEHTYARDGTYTVTLETTPSSGQAVRRSVRLTVGGQ